MFYTCSKLESLYYTHRKMKSNAKIEDINCNRLLLLLLFVLMLMKKTPDSNSCVNKYLSPKCKKI